MPSPSSNRCCRRGCGIVWARWERRRFRHPRSPTPRRWTQASSPWSRGRSRTTSGFASAIATTTTPPADATSSRTAWSRPDDGGSRGLRRGPRRLADLPGRPDRRAAAHRVAQPPRELPGSGAAEYVTTKLYGLVPTYEITVTLHLPIEQVRRRLGDGYGELDRLDDDRTLVRGHADTLDYLAFRLTALGCEFEVHDPPELAVHLRDLGARVTRAAGRLDAARPGAAQPAAQPGAAQPGAAQPGVHPLDPADSDRCSVVPGAADHPVSEAVPAPVLVPPREQG